MSRAADCSRSRLANLALLVAGSLLVGWGLTASAAGDGPPPSTAADVVSSPDPGTTAQPSQPAPGPATTASTAQSNPAPVSVRAARATASAAHSVSIVDYAFSPTAITVKAGDTVTWTETGTDPKGHTVTSSDFDSGTLAPGSVFSHTFSSPGTFSYVCLIHPNMHGTVTVAARSTSGPGNSNGSSGGHSNSSGTSGSGNSGSSAASTPSTSGAGSESAAVSSPGAAGSSGSLPSTGSDSLGLVTAGLLLIGLGVAVRLLEVARTSPRRS